jgi:hypothetical protein
MDQLINSDDKDNNQHQAVISSKFLKNICKLEKSPYVKKIKYKLI